MGAALEGMRARRFYLWAPLRIAIDCPNVHAELVTFSSFSVASPRTGPSDAALPVVPMSVALSEVLIQSLDGSRPEQASVGWPLASRSFERRHKRRSFIAFEGRSCPSPKVKKLFATEPTARSDRNADRPCKAADSREPHTGYRWARNAEW